MHVIAVVLPRRQPEGAGAGVPQPRARPRATGQSPAPALASARAGATRRPRYNPPAMVRTQDPELFREVFGRFATGVAVITSSAASGRGGMTANALCSLSLEPLLALVCFENQARTLPIVREAGRFAVNVLSSGQEDLAGVFASKLPEAEKLEGVRHRFECGLPVIDGSLAWAACELRELIAGGDHTIAIGEVIGMGLGAGEPLLWYSGRYHPWSDARNRLGASAPRPE